MMIEKEKVIKFLKETYEQEKAAEKEAVEHHLYAEAHEQQAKAMFAEYLIWHIENKM